MPSISVPTALLAGGAISGGSSLLSGVIGSGAAKTAAQQQAQASQAALQLQAQVLGQVQNMESPFVGAGTEAANSLTALTGTAPGGNPLTAALTAPYPAFQPFQPTMAQLAGTPGYQFSLDQGLKSTQNSYAAQGLGSSGAAMRGAAQYAEGLAGTTFQQQLQNYMNQQQQGFSQYWAGNQNTFNMLQPQSSLGAGAASTLTGAGVNLSAQGANSLTGIGAAQAAGTVGSANALTGGLTGVGNAAGNALTTSAIAPYLLAATQSGMYGGAGLQSPGFSNLLNNAPFTGQ